MSAPSLLPPPPSSSPPPLVSSPDPRFPLLPSFPTLTTVFVLPLARAPQLQSEKQRIENQYNANSEAAKLERARVDNAMRKVGAASLSFRQLGACRTKRGVGAFLSWLTARLAQNRWRTKCWWSKSA